jgi:type I restriction enzyme S subunit
MSKTIKLGYKQTEVGVIPEEWEVKPLRNVLKKGRLGGNYSNQDRETEYPLMKMGNLGRGAMDTSKVEYITRGVVPEQQHKLAKGDVLFNTRNTLDLVGKVAIWRDELPIAYYNSNLMRLEFDPQQVCSTEYANAALNTVGAITVLRGLATGTTSVAAIYTRDLMDMPFITPPLPEQRAIATALSDVDALLAALDRLIAKQRDLKQAAMQQLLTGQTRLPGFTGQWENAVLGDLLTMRATYGIVTAGDFKLDGVPMMRGGDIKEGRVGHDLPFVSLEKSNEYSRTILKRNDVVIALVGYPGEAAKVPERLEGANISRAVGLLRLNKLIEPDYLVSYLNSPMGRRMVLAPSAGSAQLVVNLAELNKLEFLLPPLPEQTAIATLLSDMDLELAALEQRRDKTRALKQGMMQELLTGRTRLV